MISEIFLEQLKNACQIEEIVKLYINLKPSGNGRLVGLCPFHIENSPSMVVYTKTQSFYCFGCGTGGDIVSFVMKIENLGYIEALRFLSQRVGIKFPEEETKYIQTNKHKQLVTINTVTAKFFYKSLQESNKIKKYLISNRKIEPKTIKKFGLGFAPSESETLIKYMQSQGFSVDELLAAKLIAKNNGRIYSIFRNRVMIPIINVKSEIIGFGGRTIEDNKFKYLNSPDTFLFKKSNNLFNLNIAKNNDGIIILVEGYFDAISIVQAGFNNVVATLGTALTLEQAKILSVYAKQIILAYDNDEAGSKATSRAINILSNAGLEVNILNLGKAKDPDEFIKKYGIIRFKNTVNASINALDFEFLKIKSKFNLNQMDERTKFLKEIAVWLSNISNKLEREVFTSKISNELKIDHSVLTSYVNDLIKKSIKEKHKKYQRKIKMQSIYNNIAENNTMVSQKYIISEELIICALYKRSDLAKLLIEICPVDLFITDNASIYRCIIERLKNSKPIELTNLNTEISMEKISALSKILAKNYNIMLNKDVISECISNLKEFRFHKSESKISEMDEKELKKYFENLYKSKES